MDLNECRFLGTIIHGPTLSTVGRGARKATFNLILKSVRWDPESKTDVPHAEVLGFEAWLDVAEMMTMYATGDRVLVLAQANRRKIEKDGKTVEKVRFTVLTISLVKAGRGNTTPAPAAEPPF